MKAILKPDHLVLVPEGEAETVDLAAWKAGRDGRVFAVHLAGTGLALRDLGVREIVCREPINVTSRHPDPGVCLIGNFAATPFHLDGHDYASVESFWQGLKFDDPAERRRVAAMDGPQARRAGEEAGYGETVSHAGRTARVGTRDHWDLMEAACRAKFLYHPEARQALPATVR